jgi:hypothetical protein
MNSTDRANWDYGTKKDALLCVILLVTAVTILISGAISVRHQNDLQSLQAQEVGRQA